MSIVAAIAGIALGAIAGLACLTCSTNKIKDNVARILASLSIACIVTSIYCFAWSFKLSPWEVGTSMTTVAAVSTAIAAITALGVALGDHFERRSERLAEESVAAHAVRAIYSRGLGNSILGPSVMIFNYGKFPITKVALIKLIDKESKDVSVHVRKDKALASAKQDVLLGDGTKFEIGLHIIHDTNIDLQPVIEFVDPAGRKWRRTNNDLPELLD